MREVKSGEEAAAIKPPRRTSLSFFLSLFPLSYVVVLHYVLRAVLYCSTYCWQTLMNT